MRHAAVRSHGALCYPLLRCAFLKNQYVYKNLHDFWTSFLWPIIWVWVYRTPSVSPYGLPPFSYGVCCCATRLRHACVSFTSRGRQELWYTDTWPPLEGVGAKAPGGVGAIAPWRVATINWNLNDYQQFVYSIKNHIKHNFCWLIRRFII